LTVTREQAKASLAWQHQLLINRYWMIGHYSPNALSTPKAESVS